MRLRQLFVSVLVVGFAAAGASAAVYVWTDENGVKHYSNVAPAEKADEIDKDKELQPEASPPGARQPSRRRRGSRPNSARSQSRTQTNPAASKPGGAGDGQAPEAATDSYPGERLDLKQFPIPQDQLVAREKSIISSLKRTIEQSDADRQAVIDREKKRLMQAIVDLEGASLSKFGSQKNKLRQVGYYKYRLEALMNSPDTYFDYGESDID